uniref:CCDC66 domain-containing protein n=1 Tax=Hyaloperonospora arabidopsidis (strain Emoy2) TaxID=559515 RepID=M4BI78_HYAAE
MWTSDTELLDLREVRRRREAYARALDHQIELRRSHHQQQQKEEEELERQLAPSERAPSKWLVEGGHSDLPVTAASPSLAQSDGFCDEKRQDRGVNTGEVTTAALSHPRFRVIDEREASERLRGRAQQMQWKQILDEQVREKKRLKQEEEEARRQREEDEVKKDVRCVEEQKQQQQVKRGQCVPVEARDTRAGPLHHALPSPPDVVTVKRQLTDARLSTYNREPDRGQREDDYVLLDRHRLQPGGSADAAAGHLPSHTTSRMQLPRGDERRSGNDEYRDPFDRSERTRTGDRQFQCGDDNTPNLQQPVIGQRRIIDEYRSLLMEIRREREELRRDRDDVRREKDELRVQRALLQLENEKMASLVDAQRVLNEQHQADLHTCLAQQARQQSQQRRQYQELAKQHRLSPAQDDVCGSFDLPNHQGRMSGTKVYSRLSQIRQGLSDLSMHGEHPQPAVQERRRNSPSPMSMADFVAPTPNKRMTNDFVYSPDFQQLSQNRPTSAVTIENDDNEMDQSLVGESVFVPLCPNSLNHTNNGPAPRTASPLTSAVNYCPTNCLEGSRVIESRGFYDFHQETKIGDKDDFGVNESITGSGIASDHGSRSDGRCNDAK